MSDEEDTILPNQMPSSARSEHRNPARPGAVTAQGKADNWRKHLADGLRSSRPVIPHMESEADWQRHLDGIIADFAPQNVLERETVEQIASLTWRLRRVTRYEVIVTMHHIGNTEKDLTIDLWAQNPSKRPLRQPERETILAYQQTRIIPPAHELDKIIRYETSLHRALHEVQALQDRRKQESALLSRLGSSTTSP